jgi:hypothetical protein
LKSKKRGKNKGKRLILDQKSPLRIQSGMAKGLFPLAFHLPRQKGGNFLVFKKKIQRKRIFVEIGSNIVTQRQNRAITQ